MNSPKTVKDNQQNEKRLGQKHNHISGTCLSETRPRFFFLNFVIEDTFAENNIVFLISHLAHTLIYSIFNLGIKIESIWKIKLLRYWQYISQYKIYNFKCCILLLPSIFALRSAQWSLVLCLNGWFEQIRLSSSALGSTRFRIYGAAVMIQFFHLFIH